MINLRCLLLNICVSGQQHGYEVKKSGSASGTMTNSRILLIITTAPYPPFPPPPPTHTHTQHDVWGELKNDKLRSLVLFFNVCHSALSFAFHFLFKYEHLSTVMMFHEYYARLFTQEAFLLGREQHDIYQH